eukprot:Polyplicarium_translucidae@DN82_c0_g1_i1.p1
MAPHGMFMLRTYLFWIVILMLSRSMVAAELDTGEPGDVCWSFWAHSQRGGNPAAVVDCKLSRNYCSVEGDRCLDNCEDIHDLCRESAHAFPSFVQCFANFQAQPCMATCVIQTGFETVDCFTYPTTEEPTTTSSTTEDTTTTTSTTEDPTTTTSSTTEEPTTTSSTTEDTTTTTSTTEDPTTTTSSTTEEPTTTSSTTED